MNLLRRHPVAIALVLLLLVTAIRPLSPLVDAVTGSVPGDADLDRPILYVMFAPLSNTLDALTFFTMARAEWALGVWMLALGAWGALRRSPAPITRRRNRRPGSISVAMSPARRTHSMFWVSTTTGGPRCRGTFRVGPIDTTSTRSISPAWRRSQLLTDGFAWTAKSTGAPRARSPR